MIGIISVNGEILSLDQAKISVLDRGFLFGDSIFEVIVGFEKKLLALPEHLERLYFSAKKVGISLPWNEKELFDELTTLAKLATTSKTYVRIVVTRGEGLGLVPHKTECNKIIYVLPAQETPASIYQQGISLKTRRSTSFSPGPHEKIAFYLPSIVAIAEAHKSNFDDVLWVNPLHEITEASTANIFFIGKESGSVFIETPSLDSGLLAGITRKTLLGLMNENGIECFESAIQSDELAKYDEAFLSSTMRGLVPIRRIDDKVYATTRKTAFFSRLSAIYLEWAQTQIGKKLDWSHGNPIV